MQLALPTAPAQDLQRLALQRMAWSNNLNTVGIAVEVMVVGSLSSIRSTTLIALCSCGRCGSILTARGCCCTSQDGSRHQCRWRMVASWQEKEERDSENLLSRIDALEHPKAPQLHPMAGPQVVHQAVQSLQRGARTGRTNACETLLRQFTHSKADFPFFPRDSLVRDPPCVLIAFASERFPPSSFPDPYSKTTNYYNRSVL